MKNPFEKLADWPLDAILQAKERIAALNNLIDEVQGDLYNRTAEYLQLVAERECLIQTLY